MGLSVPTWVAAEMTTQGLPPEGHPSPPTTHRRERMTPIWCPCGQPVWAGRADRHDTTTDAAPTTPEGELHALLSGRRTYEKNQRGEMTRRHIEHIQAADADHARVYVDHRCEGPRPPISDRWAPTAVTLSDEPPF